jgi:hypothetical protein
MAQTLNMADSLVETRNSFIQREASFQKENSRHFSALTVVAVSDFLLSLTSLVAPVHCIVPGLFGNRQPSMKYSRFLVEPESSFVKRMSLYY